MSPFHLFIIVIVIVIIYCLRVVCVKEKSTVAELLESPEQLETLWPNKQTVCFC